MNSWGNNMAVATKPTEAADALAGLVGAPLLTGIHNVYWKNVWNLFAMLPLADSQSIADDLTQEVFLRLWENIDSGEFAYIGRPQTRSFLALLRARVWSDYWRRKKRI